MFSFSPGKLEDFAFSERFDIIICSEVLEHLKRPEEMLNGLKELVKKDGIFLFTIPNGFGPLEIMNQIQLKASDIWLGRLVRAMKAKIKIKYEEIYSLPILKLLMSNFIT